MRTLNLLAVPTWWSISGALIQHGATGNQNLDVPAWILLVLPLAVGLTGARFLNYWTDRRIDDRRWTIPDLFRLSVWGSLSSTVPLLLFAAGIDALYGRSLLGVLWIGGAGLLALYAKVRLRSAEGLKPQLVKSGELFKRSYAMAKQMGVHLVGVFVYPTGRGRVMNAHGGARFIGMTDVCIHWLRGAQLDFVIGHELAHVQQKHGETELRVGAGAYFGVAALTLAVPNLLLFWIVFLKFGVVLIPVLVFYSVSRRLEFAADRIAVELTGDGEIAIRALANLYWRSGVPADCNTFDELFQPHPSLRKRIEAIALAGKVPLESVTRIRQEFDQRVGIGELALRR
jgi:Zn-dependent protease with chaperone function